VYDALLLMGIGPVLRHVRTRGLAPAGWLAVWFLLFYCVERFAIELLRSDKVLHLGPFRFTHVAAVLGAVAAAYLLTLGRARWVALTAWLDRRHHEGEARPVPPSCPERERARAFVVDVGIVAATGVALWKTGLFGWLSGGLTDRDYGDLGDALAQGFPLWPAVAAFSIVFVLFPLVCSRSPGMWLFGVRIETDSGRLRVGQALWRAVVLYVSMYSVIGLFRALYDPQRHALHDVVSGNASRVCRRDRWRLLGRRCLGAGSG